MPTLFNIGSLNIDRVYRVPHAVRPGETITGRDLAEHPGGKGANQSVAAARAGQRVEHVGRVGGDGVWLRDLLAAEGVGVGHVAIDADAASGHAIIQVADDGENAIFLFPGTNHAITGEQLDGALNAASEGDWVLTQNESGNAAAVLAAAARRGLHVAFNPAPMEPALHDLPLDGVDLLVVNEGEAAGLLKAERGPAAAADALGRRVRGLAVVTLGAAGAAASDGARGWRVPAAKASRVVDTTGAGDTFTGYLVAGLMGGRPVEAALQRAARAATLAVAKAGAIPSIPHGSELPADAPES